MTLKEAVEKLAASLDADYSLGPEDAKDLFEDVWHEMVSDIGGVLINKAIDDIVNACKIGF